MQRLLLALALAIVVPSQAFAQHRIADTAGIDAYLEHATETTKIPGVVAMVADADTVLYTGAFGRQDDGRKVPMSKDTLFNIASMTKPVTSVAVMMLVEHGDVALDDPIGKYLPELADKEVIEKFNASDKSYTKRPAARPITIRHLLTHTSGLGYAFASPVLAALMGSDPNASAMKLPLLHDPGAKWSYGESTRVLGLMVAKVSGRKLDEFVQERIFAPLGMTDTSYAVPAAKHDRVATVHRLTDKGTLEEQPNGATIASPVLGDGGLYSTAGDYVKFMKMFLHGGVAPNGTRLLRADTIKLMGQNHIGNIHVEQQPTTNPLLSQPFPLGAGRDTFGLGFQITGAHGDRSSRSQGSMSWAGIFNTEFWIDPARGVCGVLMMQYLPFYDADAIATLQGFEKHVYDSLSP
jgi:CubicO group peptidase (beta-lactamase class C family)